MGEKPGADFARWACWGCWFVGGCGLFGGSWVGWRGLRGGLMFFGLRFVFAAEGKGEAADVSDEGGGGGSFGGGCCWGSQDGSRAGGSGKRSWRGLVCFLLLFHLRLRRLFFLSFESLGFVLQLLLMLLNLRLPRFLILLLLDCSPQPSASNHPLQGGNRH